MNRSLKKDVEKVIMQILASRKDGLTFEELRESLEYNGYYLDGLILRKFIAHLIRSNNICKVPSEKGKKLVLVLCEKSGQSS